MTKCLISVQLVQIIISSNLAVLSLMKKIKRGEIRKVVVNLKSFNTLQTIVSGELYYRIYIKEGKTQVNVFDWTLLDKTTENSFLIDTSYLIPREYNIEIKSKIGNEVIFFENEIKFEIVSEKISYNSIFFVEVKYIRLF